MSDWRKANRANWDERVGVHLRSDEYDLAPLRAGCGKLNAIEEAELGPVQGLRVLHLQCHFGRDSLILAQRGAEVVGLDFSEPAIAQARALAAELGLARRARFVQADLYDAPAAIPEPAAFDLVYFTWGALCWLPDVPRWAQIVAHFLKPGGTLYLAEDHPAGMVFDDTASGEAGRPGWFAPYFQESPLRVDSERDYAVAREERRSRGGASATGRL
jgi:SAM-dependent methyltransferase